MVTKPFLLNLTSENCTVFVSKHWIYTYIIVFSHFFFIIATGGSNAEFGTLDGIGATNQVPYAEQYTQSARRQASSFFFGTFPVHVQ